MTSASLTDPFDALAQRGEFRGGARRALYSLHEKAHTWRDPDHSPSEVSARNFYFPSLWDPGRLGPRERIGVDETMLDVNYPHGDTSWPETRALVETLLRPFDEAIGEQMAYLNAAALCRHPVRRCQL